MYRVGERLANRLKSRSQPADIGSERVISQPDFMEDTDMELSPVAGAAQMMQQAASTVMMKKAADAQMQMANLIAQQAETGKKDAGFSVYA